MQQQPIAACLSTRTMIRTLNDASERKCGVLDVMMMAGEVAASLGACWLLHMVA